MKKYFMKGTEKEVQFGDEINATFTKTTSNGGKAYHYINSTFTPGMVDFFLKNDIIEEQEVEQEEEKEEGVVNKEELLNAVMDYFKQYDGFIDDTLRVYAEMESTIESMKKEIANLKTSVTALLKLSKSHAKAGK